MYRKISFEDIKFILTYVMKGREGCGLIFSVNSGIVWYGGENVGFGVGVYLLCDFV